MPSVRRSLLRLTLGLALAGASCSSSSEVGKGNLTSGGSDPEPSSGHATRVTIVGTNDLHGHIEALPLLGGYVQILRDDPDRAVILVDGGDMFQGTLDSNLQEGAPIIEAYNLLGYSAVTIGNHEFDFGPEGADATVQSPDQDPVGALKARAAAADFPFLSSNILDDRTSRAVSWPNVIPATLTTVKGIPVGIIGVSTWETREVTLAANVEGLSMAPLAERIAEHASELRAKGAKLVVVAAHAGGDCASFDDPKDLSSCKGHQASAGPWEFKRNEEIFEVARTLPAGAVDVIVAGHTHRAISHSVNGIAIIESFAKGKAFGRVDFDIDAKGTAHLAKIHAPRSLCKNHEAPVETCAIAAYEGAVAKPREDVAEIVARARAVAENVRSQELGIELVEAVRSSRSSASALGNLFADLMLTAHPSADVSIINGGSLRADLPRGALKYGALFEAMPFDNRFALVTLRGQKLRTLITRNLQADNGIMSISGMRVDASCKGKSLQVSMTREEGATIRDADVIVLVTSDFMALGGEGLLGSEGMEPEKTEIDGGPLFRDSMAALLTARGGALDPSDRSLFAPDKPRMKFPGERPIRCD